MTLQIFRLYRQFYEIEIGRTSLIHLTKLDSEVFFKYLTDDHWGIKKSFYTTDPISLPKTRRTMKEKSLNSTEISVA